MGDALRPEVLEADGGFGGQWVRHGDPLDPVEARPGLLDRGEVGDPRHPHGLQPATGPQRARAAERLLGQEPVEQPERLVERVLGLVHDPGARVDRDRLVLEAAHRGQRYGAGAVRIRAVHLEDEAVVLGVTVGPGPVLGLLTGQPGVPRGAPTGAVHRRPGDGDAFGEDVVPSVELQRRTPALAHRVVREPLDGRYGDRRVDPVLVVAHQPDVPAPAREGGHAVAVAGDRSFAGAERVALPGQHPVAKALREVEQAVGVGHQRTVARVTAGGGRSREELGEGAGEGDRGGGAARGQDVASCRETSGCG